MIPIESRSRLKARERCMHDEQCGDAVPLRRLLGYHEPADFELNSVRSRKLQRGLTILCAKTAVAWKAVRRKLVDSLVSCQERTWRNACGGMREILRSFIFQYRTRHLKPLRIERPRRESHPCPSILPFRSLGRTFHSTIFPSMIR